MLLIYVFYRFILYSPMNEISNGKLQKDAWRYAFFLKLFCQNVSLHIMPNWLYRTIPMSKYFSVLSKLSF